MKFTPTWYKQDVADIPSFKELEDITGSAYDEQGVYIGPKEKPDMQLVMDQRTNRQYWAPKEYDEDAVRYGAAKLEQDFNSKEWWGMVHDPHLTVGQKVSTAYIEGLKQAGKFVAKAPTELVAGISGITDAFGVDAGALVNAAIINSPSNLPIYLASSLARKGVKATAADYLQLLKDIKTPSGKMGETASLYRASAQNWAATLDKYLPDVDDNIKAHSTMVVIGSMAGQIGGSLLLAAATNGVGGLPAVASVFGSQQFYNIREEYLEKGFSLESANIYAGLAAVFEGGLEAVGFSKWLKYATLKPSLRNHLIAGLMEASQEMSQTTAEELITNLSGVREETLTEILAQIAISGVAGFLPGAGISMVSGGLGIRQEKAAYELDNALKTTSIVPQQKQKVNVPEREGQFIKGPTPKQELELAKANKGSNQLYEVVKNIANSYGVNDDKVIDGLYYFARNQAVQGKLGEELLSGLGKQMIAYKNTLALPDKSSDKENKQAAADLSFHLSKEAAEKFHNNNVKAMKERGATDQQAEVLAAQQDKIYQNLSEQFGVDLQEVKEVKVTAVPSREQVAQAQEAEQADSYEGEIPFQDRQSEADNEIKVLQKQIDELDKLANKKPKSTLLSTLRKTGVDYKNSRLDPQVLKDMNIKNVPVSKGGLGGESAEYLIRHGFIREAQQLDTVTYEDAREQDSQADDILSRAVSGEEIYRADDQEMIAQAEQAAGYKEQLQAELDGKLAEKGKRGYIKIGEILNEIVLGKTADVTTLQHELMHHWKDVIETMAAKGNKKAQALKAQMDKIIAENKDYVKQDINKEEEVLSEAFEAWLYSGVVAEDPKQQALFEAIKQYFQDVYDSVKAITGIRINPEIDMFFRQMTGEMPIQMREDVAFKEESKGKYNFKVTQGEKAGLTQAQREHIASEIINNMEGSLFSRFKVKDVKGEWPAGGNPRRAKQWWVDEKGKKTTQPNVIAGSKYHSNPKEVIKINIPGSKAVLTVHKDALAVRALFKDLGISITPKKGYANDRMYQGRISNKTKQKAREVRAALQKIAEGAEEATVANLRNDLDQYGGTNDVTFKFGDEKSGIRHIAEKHGLKTLLQVFDSVVDGKVSKFVKGKKTVHLQKNGVEAVLSLDENGNKKTWLLTGWDNKISPEEERQFRTNLNSAQSTPTFSRRDLVAGLNNSIEYEDGFVKPKKTFYQTVKAQQTGSKAADDKPSKEQIASDLQTIRNNGVEKYEPKSRLGSSLGNFGKHILLSVRQRAGDIDPKIRAFFDKLDYFQPNLEKKFASKAHGFVKKFQKLTETEKNEFDYYVYNQCHEELNAFLKEKGMAQEYQEVRQLLNFIYAISNKAGIDMGFIEEYFPTSMIDYAGFLDYMKGTDKWSYIAKALHEADPQGVWSDKEKAEAVNKLLRGYRLDPVSKPKNANERKILYKSPELMRFYEHSDVALVKYLQGMSQAIAINKAFGKGGGFDTDATIGAIVLELIESGTITNKEEAEIRRLLKSRLSYGATPEFMAMVKNVGYLQTMNNITSAITQLGDLYAPFYKYSFGTAIKSIFGKSEITKTDLGLDKIWEEFADNSKTGIAVEKLFKAIGLEAMDSFGKNVAINASWLNLKEQAANGDMELLARLSYTFGKDAQKVLADIKAGNITDDVKILIWADLADTQPIGRSGVPTGYLDNPHGRIFYQLKTFTLNQISLFYADSLVNIQKGIKYRNKEQFLKGVQNGFKLLLLLTAGNAAADVLKNLIMGRDIDISDTVVSNLLWNVGVSKYTFYKGKRDGYVRSILSSYLMPPQVSAFDDMQLDMRKIATGKRKLKDTAAVTYLPFGRAYYWWFGGGRTAEKEKAKKAKKKKR